MKRHPLRSIALDGLVAGILVVALTAVAYSAIGTQSAQAAVQGLHASGAHRGSAFLSGRIVTLRWQPISGATSYTVRVARSASAVRGAALNRLFTAPWKTGHTTTTHYAVQVVGASYYYWRVTAATSSRIIDSKRAGVFVVSRPSVGRPALSLPRSGAHLAYTSRQRLCWSAVRGAEDYVLTVNGQTTHQRGSCAQIAVHPGNYSWKVAARVRGIALYTGATSHTGTFSVQSAPTPTPRPKPVATPASSQAYTPPSTQNQTAPSNPAPSVQQPPAQTYQPPTQTYQPPTQTYQPPAVSQPPAPQQPSNQGPPIVIQPAPQAPQQPAPQPAPQAPPNVPTCEVNC